MNTVKAKYLLNMNHFEITRHYRSNTTSNCSSEIPVIFDGPLEFILTRFHCTYISTLAYLLLWMVKVGKRKGRG